MKLSVFCGVSVDGFLARPDDTFDFLQTGEQGASRVQGIPCRRRCSRDRPQDFRSCPEARTAWHFTGDKPVIVLSSRLLDFSSAKSAIVEQTAGEPTEIVRQLKARGFKHAYLDGGVTIQRFLAAGCVDGW
jgi:hypothetical protein